MDSLQSSVRVTFKIKVFRWPPRGQDTRYGVSVSEETPRRILNHHLDVTVPYNKEPEKLYQFTSLPDKVADKISEMITEIHASPSSRTADEQARWKIK